MTIRSRDFKSLPQSEGHDRDSWLNGSSGLNEIQRFAEGTQKKTRHETG